MGGASGIRLADDPVKTGAAPNGGFRKMSRIAGGDVRDHRDPSGEVRRFQDYISKSNIGAVVE